MKLELGYNHPFEIRREYYPFSEQLRIAFLSDLHFNKRSQPTAEALITQLNQLKPDMVLLGGDYVDTTGGLIHLRHLLQNISCTSTFAIAGNHDHFFDLERIRSLMFAANVHWLDNSVAQLTIRDTTLHISNAPGARSRADLNILLLHKPINIAPFQSSYHLAFAGHLHGCQFVAWQSPNGLYPGRWFYRHNMLKAVHGSCHYHISKGLGDTLPIRYNCKKDFIFVTTGPQPLPNSITL